MLDVDFKASRKGLFCGGGKFFYLLIFSRQISVDLRREVVRPALISSY
jgi:hypothetical protein